MKFTIIDKSAEDMFYAWFKADSMAPADESIATQLVQCRFFHIGTKPSIDDVTALFQDDFPELECTLYLCEDGDLFFRWADSSPDILETIKLKVFEHYNKEIKKYVSIEEFFIDYDSHQDSDKLKAICQKKVKTQTVSSKELTKYLGNKHLIRTLHQTMSLVQMQRAFRAKPHILIVEDQIFSQKILKSILSDYTLYVVDSVGEALLLYLEKCPDIILLDIELPDLSGHKLANLINQIDKTAYIVMVSANKGRADLEAAKVNKVKGFVVKPYEKHKILDVVTQYNSWKKTKK